jgi:hypothetical protein
LKFSERKGLVPVSQIIQTDQMSDELRNTLWSILDLVVWQKEGFMDRPYRGRAPFENYAISLWLNYFKKPVDTIPPDVLGAIRKYYFNCEWNEVYDFIEFTLNHLEDENLNEIINSRLGLELSGYRYISGVITDITDEQEVDLLENALSNNDFPAVKLHLKRALEAI